MCSLKKNQILILTEKTPTQKRKSLLQTHLEFKEKNLILESTRC